MAGRASLSVWLAAALGACSPEAAPYKNPIDRLLIDYGRAVGFQYWPCSYVTVSSGIEVIESIDMEDCYRFDRPRRMQGVWLIALETSDFLPDATRSPAVWNIMDENVTFLHYDWERVEKALPPPIKGEDSRSPAAYAIEFIGRPASYPGVYGMVGDRHMAMLDTLISARAIPPPRPPDWDAIIAETRRRRAADAAGRPRPVWPRVTSFFLSLWTMAPGLTERETEPDNLQQAADQFDD